jgi:hypothetical protein
MKRKGGNLILKSIYNYTSNTELWRVKYLFLLSVTIIGFLAGAQPPLIHSHNDYQQPEPLTNALRYKVFSIEADVYLRDSTLLVAHTKNELATAPTLDALYLQPIIRLYSLHHGRISSDNQYAPVLMIDIKERGEAVLAQLIKQLSRYRSVFDRSLNPKAVQIVISGDRGPQPLWTTYPLYIFFDGRPYENYDSATLKRIGFISDSYANYAWPADSTAINLQRVVNKVHSHGKLLRLWGISDNPASWKQLRKQGIDIINTDKVAECRKYFF